VINIKSIVPALRRLSAVASVNVCGDSSITIVATERATSENGSTDRIYAALTNLVRNHGGYSRAVSSSEVGFTDEGAGMWMIRLD
jgi:hypothetical protein